MKKLSVLFSFFLLLVLQACSRRMVCSAENPAFVATEGFGKKVDKMILVEKTIPFSGSILIEESNQVVLNKSYNFQNAREACKINPELSYWIASLSKQFCAAAILLLQEKNLLLVNEPISKYLKSVPEDKKDITLHQLLTHTSGLPNLYAAEGFSDRRQAAAAILKNSLIHPIGTKYAYSNDGYQLLAIIVEEVSGELYEAFLNKHFFTPLSMKHTGCAGDQQKWNALNVAEKGPKASKKLSDNPQNWTENYGYKGATGILSATEDLLKWHHAIKENSVLSKASTDLLFENHALKDAESEIYYGYGWNLFNTKNGQVIVHSGDDDFIGHNSTFRYYPEKKKLIIVLSNAGYFKNNSIAQEMSSKIINLVFP